jgi:hypothetical protein
VEAVAPPFGNMYLLTYIYLHIFYSSMLVEYILLSYAHNTSYNNNVISCDFSSVNQ